MRVEPIRQGLLIWMSFKYELTHCCCPPAGHVLQLLISFQEQLVLQNSEKDEPSLSFFDYAVATMLCIPCCVLLQLLASSQEQLLSQNSENVLPCPKTATE
jgi:hypothetical protein